MNAADILMYGFLLVAVCVVTWVAYNAGENAARRMYEAELATARGAARRYRADLEREQDYIRMLRRGAGHPSLRGVHPHE